MSKEFLKNDAIDAVEAIKTVFARLGISKYYIAQTLNQLGSFLLSKVDKVNEIHRDFVASHLSIATDIPAKTPFRIELANAEFFLPDDAYIRLSVAFSNIVDYFASVADDYSERQSRDLVRSTKDLFLLQMQKENKGLSLVYLARR